MGDQGGCAGNEFCDEQKQVAEKMKTYVANRKAKNPNSELLFVLSVGDNFYWTGVTPGRFDKTWADIYGDTLTSVPWFAVLGNHDYGNDDPGTGCPDTQSRFTCNSANQNSQACGGSSPYSTEPQGYNGNFLDIDKGGVGRGEHNRLNWHQPDYTYYYSIPALDFELVALDWNAYDIGGLGGNGLDHGASKMKDLCGGVSNVVANLNAIKDASTEVLNNRAEASASKNVAIIGHYPDGFQQGHNFREMYLDHMDASKRDGTKIFNFYGHTHHQECFGTSGGECVNFLTGGSGGCCGRGDVPAGFVAIAWDSDATQKVECFTPDHDCTINPYGSGSRRLGATSNVTTAATLEVTCEKTISGDKDCPNYVPPQDYKLQTP